MPAYTIAKLAYEEVKSGSRKQASIRVYVQMPYVDTEFKDAKARRRQATRYKPPLGYSHPLSPHYYAHASPL